MKIKTDEEKEVYNFYRRILYLAFPEVAAERQKRKLSDPIEKRKHYLRCKDWSHRNRDKIKEYDRREYLKNPRKMYLRSCAYKARHPEKVKEWRKSAYHRGRQRIEVVIAMQLRNRLRQEIRRPTKSNRKLMSAIELVGCSIPFLIQHLEQQFREGMTWGNYGRGWHIDHIRPVSSFNLIVLQEQKDCFHFTNLQPLWAVDNLRKGRRTDFLRFEKKGLQN